jgi:DNA-binding NtrC family response regulator
VFSIELPPLSDRLEDIPLLVHHFAAHDAARMGKRITAISDDFMAALVRQSWPGNVREAARLDVPRTTLIYKMKRPGILGTAGPDLRRASSSDLSAEWSLS